ncbi:MAG TPA: SAF domain-containing protein [Chloroflexota bacterium]|nr:SAF domain-containing protein [Chloroflexota bacterium]HUM69149.1 SAF domain-containing protein [Chloroflexota bacterium]
MSTELDFYIVENKSLIDSLLKRDVTSIDDIWVHIGAKKVDFDEGICLLAEKLQVSKEELLKLLIAHIFLLTGEYNKTCANRDKANIRNMNDLWEFVGSDFDNGIKNLSQKINYDVGNLVSLLSAIGHIESEQKSYWEWPRRRRFNMVRKKWKALEKNWLELSIALGGLAILFLLTRATGFFPWSLGLSDNVVIAAKNLEAGHIITSQDLSQARISATDFFPNVSELEGLKVTNTLAKGDIIEYTDIARKQVVAINDISQGTILYTDLLTTTWTTYHPEAVLAIDEVIGFATSYDIQGGDILLKNQVGNTVQTVNRVVISSTTEIPPFHIIQATDITLLEKEALTNGFEKISDVIGHYSLQPLQNGDVLNNNNLSEITVSDDLLADRHILTIPIQNKGVVYTDGAVVRVSLLFSPLQKVSDSQNPSAPSKPEFLLTDVLILGLLDTDGGKQLAIAAVQKDDLPLLSEKLGSSQVFILYSIP